jgi:hypothetical protein
MTRKLWSFGCSWAAGSSLGTGITQDELKSWFLKETGYDNYQDGIHTKLINSTINAIDQENIIIKWDSDYKGAKSAELSYAGRLANKLGLQLKSFAIPGTGNDRSYYNLQRCVNIIDWDNDLVLFDLSPEYRYMTDEHNKKTDLQVALVEDPAVARTIPSNTTLELLTSGIFAMIDYKFNSNKDRPLVHFVNTNFGEHNLDLSNIHFIHTCFINKIGNDMYGKYWRYPSGHAIESVHDAFATHLLEDKFIAKYAKRYHF